MPRSPRWVPARVRITPYCTFFQSCTEEIIMSVLDDLRDAISNYPTDNCSTTIEDFSVTSGVGSGLNVGDEFQYKVRISNDGELDMKNVKIRVNGTKWADVALSGSTGKFGSTALLEAPLNIDARTSFTTGFFRGKGKLDTCNVAGTYLAKDIVSAQIDGYDASLDHVLIDHSGAGEDEGKLNQTVVKS